MDVFKGPLQDERIQIAFIFGSIAKGKIDAESDVDLMVIGEIGLRNLSRLLSGIPERIGREVNPYALSPMEFRKRFQALSE